MHNNADTPQDFSMQQAMLLAGTPAGQQLIALLQKNGGAEFHQAMAKAAAGDFEQAKRIISATLSSKEAQELLKQLGR